MTIRIGEIMVQHGVLTKEQVKEILAMQSRVGRPFGVLAEDMFGVSEEAVEQAWVEQYAALTRGVSISARDIDPAARQFISRRQAWQFRVLPIRFDGQELMIATCREHLARAVRFASRCLCRPCYFVVVEADALGQALMEHFPMPGMTPEAVLGEIVGNGRPDRPACRAA